MAGEAVNAPTLVELHDSAIAATEAWQSDPNDTTKETATKAVATAKEAQAQSKIDSEAQTKKDSDAAEVERQKNLPPEKYELKLPENSSLDDAALERIATDAKSQGLSQEQAQAQLERESSITTAIEERRVAAEKVVVDGWLETTKADAEIGGEHFAKNIELAHRVLQRFGSPAMTEMLKKTGLGNHPELVRAFNRIGKAMGEDNFVTATPAPTNEPRDPAEVLYGTPVTTT